jgi:hypothetical protein
MRSSKNSGRLWKETTGSKLREVIDFSDLPGHELIQASPLARAEDYDSNGIDRTLIRACLRDTPLQCLDVLEEMHQLAESVKRDGEPVSSTD